MTVGGDGALCCWGWNFSDKGKNRAAAAVDASRARLSHIVDVRKEQDAALRDMEQLKEDSKSSMYLDLIMSNFKCNAQFQS